MGEVNGIDGKYGGLRCKGYVKSSSKDMPLISVVTVVYNGVENIERTINSVIKQSYRNVEYIIIDGGSTDGTLDVIRKYERYIDYWSSERDKGISDAFNKGIQLCAGEYVGLLNADDWYEINTVQYVVDSIKGGRPDVLYGKMRYWSEKVKKTYIPDHHKLHRYMSIYHPAMFVLKSSYVKYGGYSDRYKIAMDYDFVYRVMKSGGRFSYVPHVLTNMESGGVSSRHIYKSIREVATVKIVNTGKIIYPSIYYVYQTARHAMANILRRLGIL